MNKIAVLGTNGKRASPYKLDPERKMLLKQVSPKHIYRLRQAVGVDQDVWEACKARIRVVRFQFPDDSIREIPKKDFERLSFTVGDGITFIPTLFIPISELREVRSGMIPLPLERKSRKPEEGVPVCA